MRRMQLEHEMSKLAVSMKNIVSNAHRRDPVGSLHADEQRRFDDHAAAGELIKATLSERSAGEQRLDTGAAVRMANPGVFGSSMGQYEREDAAAASLRSFLSPDGPRQLRIPIGGAMRAAEARRSGGDIRAALQWDTGSVGSTVPTLMGNTLYEIMAAEIAVLRMPTTKLVTPTGANFDYPKLSIHGIGTQVSGQGTAIGGTDPGFDKVSFGAYKYGQLVSVSAEVLEDSSVDIVDLIMRNSARALGRVIDTDLVLGAGSGKPLGIMASGAVGAAGTVATGGTAIYPTYEKLIDFQYSVNDAYRSSGNAAWLFSDRTAANLRKLRDGAGGTTGAPLWASSTTAGIAGVRQPPMLLGDPAFVDANVANIGTAASLIAAYGDWSAYVVRLVHDVILERDDSYAFDKDLVTFRAKHRIDARLLDVTALNRLNAAPA